MEKSHPYSVGTANLLHASAMLAGSACPAIEPPAHRAVCSVGDGGGAVQPGVFGQRGGDEVRDVTAGDGPAVRRREIGLTR